MDEGYCPHCQTIVKTRQEIDWCLSIFGFILGFFPGLICMFIELAGKPADRCTLCGTQVLAAKPGEEVNAIPPPPTQVVVKPPSAPQSKTPLAQTTKQPPVNEEREARFCPNCGEKMPPGGRFCPRCGAEVDL
jgi:hypothetical protein